MLNDLTMVEAGQIPELCVNEVAVNFGVEDSFTWFKHEHGAYTVASGYRSFRACDMVVQQHEHISSALALV